MAGVPLSEIELKTLRLFSKGWTCPDIAKQRGVSHHTCRSHQKSIRAKLRAETMAHAVAVAKDAGII